MSESVDNTYVATPNQEIREAVESFGGEAIMTGSHPRATDRVAEAAEGLDSDIVIVMQGDEPLVYPEMIDDAVEPIIEEDDVRCTNLAKSIETEESFRDPNNVKIVVDDNWDALYFSREPIPNLHDAEFEEVDVYKQVCVIPFEREFLFEFTSMEETTLEKIESIDMLRLLENGYDGRLAEMGRSVYAVDNARGSRAGQRDDGGRRTVRDVQIAQISRLFAIGSLAEPAAIEPSCPKYNCYTGRKYKHICQTGRSLN
jgi:3-deoxy-manno-octulosonate cytidylyltransferase (CMP-KDO synthetase)